jgi:hypothetical protein
LRFDGKAEFANNLHAHSISQADIFETKQLQPLCRARAAFPARRATTVNAPLTMNATKCQGAHGTTGGSLIRHADRL